MNCPAGPVTTSESRPLVTCNVTAAPTMTAPAESRTTPEIWAGPTAV
jgi:hypothetical protein